jgi:hypothetical protein
MLAAHGAFKIPLLGAIAAHRAFFLAVPTSSRLFLAVEKMESARHEANGIVQRYLH